MLVAKAKVQAHLQPPWSLWTMHLEWDQVHSPRFAPRQRSDLKTSQNANYCFQCLKSRNWNNSVVNSVFCECAWDQSLHSNEVDNARHFGVTMWCCFSPATNSAFNPASKYLPDSKSKLPSPLTEFWTTICLNWEDNYEFLMGAKFYLDGNSNKLFSSVCHL